MSCEQAIEADMRGEEPLEIKHSAEFEKLDQAIEWATANCCQGAPGCAEDEQELHPMLVITKQKPYRIRDTGEIRGRRTFVALSAALLEQFFDSFRGEAERHLDEVIPGDAPCKFALDCDWKVSKHGLAGRASEAELFRDLDASCAALAESVVALLAERHGARVEPCASTAVRAGKWSMHVVFDGAVWKSSRHCRALANELIAADVRQQGSKEKSLLHTYVDVGVYSTNHSLRMYRSSKVDEPMRAFRRLGESAAAPLDGAFLRKSTITLFQVAGAGDGKLYYVTSLFARRFGAMLNLSLLEHADAHSSERKDAVLRPRSLVSTATAIGGGEWTRAFVQAFNGYGAYKAEAELELGRLRLLCLNHNCAIKGAAHSSENIFLQVDLLECLWRQCCFNVTCRKTPTKWQPLSDELTDMCSVVYEQWSGARTATELSVYTSRLAAL